MAFWLRAKVISFHLSVLQNYLYILYFLSETLVKEKAEILVEMEKLARVKDELTAEVDKLATQLQQERTKVSALTDVKKVAVRLAL